MSIMNFFKKINLCKPFLNVRGSALLEVLFGISLVSLVLLSLLGAYSFYLKNSFRLTEKIQASFLVEEGIESLRIIRDDGWSSSFGSFISETPYYLSFDGSTWKATTSATSVDGLFWRTFVISNVNRNSEDDIVEVGGINDPDTKKASLFVSWNSGGSTSTLSVSTYFTNLFSN